MVGLPTERCDDLLEFIELVGEMKQAIDAIGRPRGRLTEIHVSANCFVPKPWTPFQFHPFGISSVDDGQALYSVSESLKSLRGKIGMLKKGFRTMANVHFQADKPDNALFQAVLARGDRRLAHVLADMAIAGRPWKSSAKRHSIDISQYILRTFDEKSFFPWYIIDHSVKPGYLWQEYQKAFRSAATEPCDPAICRRCGVCGER